MNVVEEDRMTYTIFRLRKLNSKINFNFGNMKDERGIKF